MPRVVQRGRQEPDVAWLFDRVLEVQSVRVRVRDDCKQNHVAIQMILKHNIYLAMNAKDYGAEWKWMNLSLEAKQRSAAAKAQALSEFKKRFPRADMSKFIAQVEFDSHRKATARVLLPDGGGSWENALIEDSKYWSQPLKDALGMQQDGGFPYQLSLLQQNKPQPVPAVDFADNITQSVADIFNKEVNIYVTPTDYFTTKFRQIFTKTQIKIRNTRESGWQSLT